MKITVGIPSRGRPLELAASVLTLDKTRCGAHAVEFIVAHDHDDGRTMEVVSQLTSMGLPLRSSFGPRPLGLGEIQNRLLAESDPDSVFLLWSDRLVPISEQWDHGIATAVLEFPNRILWMDSIHLQGAGQYIVTPMWRAALPDGKIAPGCYPFWFEDTAVEEDDAFVFGLPRISIWPKAAGPRTDKTNRMRDLPFWIGFFAATRTARIARAREIAKRLGLPARDNADLIAHFEARDQEFLSRTDELTAQYSAGGEPDETYLRAKMAAEDVLAGIDPLIRKDLSAKFGGKVFC